MTYNTPINPFLEMNPSKHCVYFRLLSFACLVLLVVTSISVNADPIVRFQSDTKAEDNFPEKFSWELGIIPVSKNWPTKAEAEKTNNANVWKVVPASLPKETNAADWVGFEPAIRPRNPNIKYFSTEISFTEINNNSSLYNKELPSSFMPVSWEGKIYSDKIQQITFKPQTANKPASGILIRRLSGDNPFWSNLATIDQKSAQVNLHFTTENIELAKWIIIKGRKDLVNCHLLPIEVNEDAKNYNFGFPTYEEVLENITQEGDVLIYHKFGGKNKPNVVEINKEFWTIQIAVNTVSDGVPRPEAFQNFAKIISNEKSKSESTVIWLRAMQVDENPLPPNNRQTILPPTDLTEMLLLQKATDVGVALVTDENDPSTVLVSNDNLKKLSDNNNVSIALDPILEISGMTSEWISAKRGEDIALDWVNIADSGAPQCIRFYFERLDEKFKLRVAQATVVDVDGLEKYQIEKWKYKGIGSEERELAVKELDSRYFVLLKDQPKVTELMPSETGWEHTIALKIASNETRDIRWSISLEEYSSAFIDSNKKILRFEELLKNAKQTKTYKGTPIEISPYNALQSDGSIKLFLKHQNLAFESDLSDAKIELAPISYDTEPKRFIKEDAADKKGYMILVDNYQPWSVGTSGKSSLQSNIWDSVEKAVNSLSSEGNVVVVGLVNQGYEVLGGGSSLRQNQVALFKLRRLVLNEYDLKQHGTSREQLYALLDSNVRHQNPINNTLATILSDAGKWKACFVTPILENALDQNRSPLAEMDVKANFIQISMKNSDVSSVHLIKSNSSDFTADLSKAITNTLK